MKIIDELRLIKYYNNGLSKNNKLVRQYTRSTIKFSWVEINDDSRGTYNTSGQIKCKTTMLKSSLSGYSDAYILVKATITIAEEGDDAAARQANERNKGVVFKNCTPFTDCIS